MGLTHCVHKSDSTIQELFPFCINSLRSGGIIVHQWTVSSQDKPVNGLVTFRYQTIALSSADFSAYFLKKDKHLQDYFVQNTAC